MFKLTVKTDNAAFEDNAAAEVARILRDTAKFLDEQQPVRGSLRDINGNRVGEFHFDVSKEG